MGNREVASMRVTLGSVESNRTNVITDLVTTSRSDKLSMDILSNDNSNITHFQTYWSSLLSHRPISVCI